MVIRARAEQLAMVRGTRWAASTDSGATGVALHRGLLRLGEDFLAVEIMYGRAAIATSGALVNLLDEITRTGVPLDAAAV